MLGGLESSYRSGPTTMTMRIEEARIGFFQAAFGAETRRSERAATSRTRKEKHVRKLFGYLLQRTLDFLRGRDKIRLAEVGK